MSPSSNSSPFPPKHNEPAGTTRSRETDPAAPSGNTPSSPFGNKTGAGSGFASRFATPTLKPAGTTPLSGHAAHPDALGNPFSKPAQSALKAAPSPFGKPATPSAFAKTGGTTTTGTPPSTGGAASLFSKSAQSAFNAPATSPFGKTGAATATGSPLFGKTTAQAPAPAAQKTGMAKPPLTSRLGQQPSFRPTALLKKETGGETPSSPFRSTNSAVDSGKPPSFSSIFRPAPEGSVMGTGGSAFSGFRPKTPAPAGPATTPFRKDLQISDTEFLQLRDFIYQQCGIFIAENRKYLVENRLSNRIKELNLKSYSEYYNFLRFDAGRRDELKKLFEVVTTNETSFFRNPPQLKVFQDCVLSEVIADCRRSGKKRIRIWSAGCSTGEEPYTLAIILQEVLKNEIASWDIKITANDLSEAVLAAARRGVYNEYALRTTPPEIIRTYFTKEGTTYKITPSLKRLVSFGQINLSDREQLRRVEKSQIVFCRNVIIYFDDEMKRKVIGAFYDNLEPNGMLLIGHSESLHNISRAFKPEHHTGAIVYRKLG